ncbi:pilus assembly protein [Agaribacterium sp. ZY112]|uniref:pilus assembly protein n=1 Tax=Agaribacterium sp. ZY112 TaxID=3233574 RepID=UPI00352601BF
MKITCFKRMLVAGVFFSSHLLGANAYSGSASASDFSVIPPFLVDTTDPFVMISLSVELTQQENAYTDSSVGYYDESLKHSACYDLINVDIDDDGSTETVGVCYDPDFSYIGYFDSNKCYVYNKTDFSSDTNTEQDAIGPYRGDGHGQATQPQPHYFKPVGLTNDKHECSGEFSGNFLNWSTMTALDQFRRAMTGGSRLVDTIGPSAQTLLTRTHRYGDWKFRTKAISKSGLTSSNSDGSRTFIVDPSTVTPFSSAALVSVDNGGNYANRVRFYDDKGVSLGEYNVIVEVCNDSIGIEENCEEYTNGNDIWYKPEGVMQRHAEQMRFALTSYSAQDGRARNGGLLRANAKHIGYLRPDVNGDLEVNPEAEVNQYGQLVFDPDGLQNVGQGINNSGILNYINSFGLGPERYKGADPVAELFYEGLRYIKALGPTPEYSGASGSLLALTNDQKDNFPVINSSSDWVDPVLDSCQPNYMVAVGDQFAHADHNLPGTSITGGQSVPTGEPSNADSDINVDAETDTIGTLENFHSGSLGSTTRGRDNNGWYVAGLAYYANTNDVRSDFDGVQSVRTFFVDTQEYKTNPPMREENPLWMAAKYGGFVDENDDNDPNNGVAPKGNRNSADPSSSDYCGSTDEWDANGDCEPDTYTLANQPALLVEGLNDVFNSVAAHLRASSAAGVIANTSGGEAMVVQAMYKAEATDDSGNQAKWLGILHSLFIDSFGNVREDTKEDGVLTNDDRVIKFTIHEAENYATADLYTTSDGGETVSALPVETDVSLEDLKTLWNTRDQLAAVSDYTSQRAYDSLADTGRHIISAIDADFDGHIRASEVVDFDDTVFTDAGGVSNNFRLLGLDSATGSRAQDLVNFIRGEEGLSGARSRTLDYLGDGILRPWLLGDIVTSSPAVVGEPDSSVEYYSKYGDDSYLEFQQYYEDRRHMVYVGANDGMLHAINGGFLKHSSSGNGYVKSISGKVAHPLGSELWAYVPANVLPHLQWLPSINYPHVYYVDGIPQVFEVNIFSDDADHPGGWGTILVVGLRFGGAQITVDPDSDFDVDTSDDYTSGSSYVIFDITNPEKEPVLISEITHPNMGFATTRPALVKSRTQNSNGQFQNNAWHLVFGSGPYGSNDTTREEALKSAVSDQTAKIFAFDLLNKSLVSFGGVGYLELSSEVTSFTGDFTSADWDGDFEDDEVYFGTVKGTISSPEGSLMKLNLGSGATQITSATAAKVLSDVNKPFSGKPHVMDIAGEQWLFTGTGRFYVPEDNLSTGQQGYYGIYQPHGATPITEVNLADVGDIHVEFNEGKTNGPIYNGSGSTPTISVAGTTYNPNSFVELRSAIKTGPGWRFEFSDSKAKHAGQSDSSGLSVGFTEYIGTGDRCEPFGETMLNLVHFGTGTAAPFSATGFQDTTTISGKTLAKKSESIAVGFVRDVKFIKGKTVVQGGLGDLTVVQPQTAGAATGRVSWREIIINW